MGGSYRQCTECGKRALSIATRCPGCGRDLTEPPVREPGTTLDLGRFLTPRAVGGALAAAAVLAVATLGSSGGGSGERALFTADSLAASVETGFSSTAAAGLDSASAAARAAESAGELLVAKTWTRVRKSRGMNGELEAVLLPGDTVVADSLRRGWYRVTLDGEVLGYAHRSTLSP
jgi:hypothetical protein